jgi:hydroxyacylglutathione hydrolase
MFLQTVKSAGLAHMSYILGHGGEAAVIDPRRDCDIYFDIAHRQGAQIKYVFETHRNEDYVIGSKGIADRSGAQIYHGEDLDFHYGNPVSENDVFEVGDLRLKILKTPGHTFESISIALIDTQFSDDAVGVLTGDCLFIGQVGRTDFFPDRKEEVAALQYDSIFNKILPLGDQTILYPAHGAGSVCGSGMAEREFSTLGYERKHNPMLQLSRDDFIQTKASQNPEQPPYFRKMEELNLNGAPGVYCLPKPKPLSAKAFHSAMKDGMVAVDIRPPESSAGTYIPGSYAMSLEMVPGFAGWFLDYDTPIGLIAEEYQNVMTAVEYLVRLGYEQVTAYLADGMTDWETAGLKYERIPALFAADLGERIRSGESFTLLDVREPPEFQEKHLDNSVNIYVGHLPDHLDEIPKDRPVTTFCSSGHRATVAASVLKRHGFENVETCLGSMQACEAVGCAVVSGE